MTKTLTDALHDTPNILREIHELTEDQAQPSPTNPPNTTDEPTSPRNNNDSEEPSADPIQPSSLSTDTPRQAPLDTDDRVQMTFRLLHRNAQDLKYAANYNKLIGDTPDTQQSIIDEALQQWFEKTRILDKIDRALRS